MVVGSDILIRQPLAEYLRESGHKVIEATDAGEARHALGLESLAVDIVLANADSAADGGFVLAQWIRTHYPGVEIRLAGSTATFVASAGELYRAGPGGVSRREPHSVLERIRRSLATRRRSANSR